MRGSNALRKVGLAALLSTVAVGAAACGSSSDSGSGGSATASGGSSNGKTYKIVMTDGFVNQWRSEMQEATKAIAANDAPYKGNVDYKLVMSQQSPTAQIQTLNNIIAQRPDAILIEALSPTALNPVVKKACAQGITVVFFDQVADGMEPCAYRVHNDNYKLFENNAEWLAKTLKGKGRIIQDLGLPGSPVSQAATKEADVVFKKYPGIKVVARYEGNYAPGPSKQAVTRILTSNKNIDGLYGVAGVDGAVQAFEETGTKFVPTTNFGDMSVRFTNLLNKYESKGLEASMAENAPTVGAQALQVAWLALHKKSVFDPAWGLKRGADDKEVIVPLRSFNTNDTPPIAGFEKTNISELKAMSKGLPENTIVPFSLPQSPVTPQQVLGK